MTTPLRTNADRRPRALVFIVAYFAESTILEVLRRIPALLPDKCQNARAKGHHLQDHEQPDEQATRRFP